MRRAWKEWPFSGVSIDVTLRVPYNSALHRDRRIGRCVAQNLNPPAISTAAGIPEPPFMSPTEFDSDVQDIDLSVALKPKKKKGPAKTQAPPRMEFFEEDEYSPEEYEAMLEMYEETLSSIEEGEIVKARVLRVTDERRHPRCRLQERRLDHPR